MDIRVQEAAFDLGTEANGFVGRQSRMGAVVTFTGIVRDLDDTDLRAMQIEHYPGMTQKALEKIAQEARDRWNRRPPPRRCLPGCGIPDGLPEISRAFLEKGSDRDGRGLGCCPRRG